MRRRTKLIAGLLICGGVVTFASTNMTARNFYHALSYERTLDSYHQVDTTKTDVERTVAPDGREAAVLSAFFGLDNGLPPLAGRILCKGAAGQDGMPVVFSHEVDLATLEPGDFMITTRTGKVSDVTCLTMAPADDAGELRTALLIGDLGSIDDQPISLEITGNILGLDGSVNFKGAKTDVVSLESGPQLVHAASIPQEQWRLGQSATKLKFGGGSGCPVSTQQIVRVTWDGGITKPNNHAIDDLERVEYKVDVLGADQERRAVVPFAVGDLHDGDNNHNLCLDTVEPALSVSFPANLVTDPRGDLNPATSIDVTR